MAIATMGITTATAMMADLLEEEEVEGAVGTPLEETVWTSKVTLCF